MSFGGGWPLLAFVFVPGAFAWWSGRRLAREPADAAVPERLQARAQHTQRAMLLSCVCLVFGAGSYYWAAMVGLVGVLWVGEYPSRRVLLDERWGLLTYLIWRARFTLACLGFWFTLLLCPAVLQAAGPWRWPAAALLALLLGLWSARYAEIFVWLVGARPVAFRPEWQAVIDRSRAARPQVFEMPVPGGRFVNAVAFPSLRTSRVLFTASALELLTPREQTAVFAHEVAHLEHHDRRRRRIAAATSSTLVALGTLGAALALQQPWGAVVVPAWSLAVIAILGGLAWRG
jgi:Zn-dependent protease with chaperone function